MAWLAAMCASSVDSRHENITVAPAANQERRESPACEAVHPLSALPPFMYVYRSPVTGSEAAARLARRVRSTAIPI